MKRETISYYWVCWLDFVESDLNPFLWMLLCLAGRGIVSLACLIGNGIAWLPRRIAELWAFVNECARIEELKRTKNWK